MEKVYLPGTIRERIQDLMKEHKISQTELAAKIGCTDSMLSRYFSGRTDHLNDESIVRIAQEFQVSTDFLLGLTNIPDRKNYTPDELGLSVEAVKNLYTGKANTGVVSRLLENQYFLLVTNLIAQYLDDTLAAGFAAQNQLISSLNDLLKRSVPEQKGAMKAVGLMKQPVYQADLTAIQNTFMTAVKEIKKETDPNTEPERMITKSAAEKVFGGLSKDSEMSLLSLTPEQVAGAVTGTVAQTGEIDPSALEKLNQALTEIMRDMIPKEQNEE